MKYTRESGARLTFLLAASLFFTMTLSAQQQEGPQTEAPPPVAPKPAPAPQAASNEKIIVPAGCKMAFPRAAPSPATLSICKLPFPSPSTTAS
jgi:hypothetical protein